MCLLHGQVRVVDVDDEEDGDCSDEFYLLASDEAPMVGDSDGPRLTVTSPGEGDMAVAGDEYTIEVSFCELKMCSKAQTVRSFESRQQYSQCLESFDVLYADRNRRVRGPCVLLSCQRALCPFELKGMCGTCLALGLGRGRKLTPFFSSSGKSMASL